MNPQELTRLAQACRLEDADRMRLRLAFGIACIERAQHLLTDDEVVGCLRVGKAFLAGTAGDAALHRAARDAAALAARHPGSGSIDGAGNAAVSASFGVAAALAGRALQAAEYAAYAVVYAYASHAVTDPGNYADEHAWQVETLRALAARQDAAPA